MQDLLLQVDQNHKTDLLPLPKLVELAERGCFEDGQAEAYLREVLQEYDLSQYCTVVLGCTHFNYFKDSFRNIFGDGVTLLDGSGGTVNNLHRVLAEKNLLEQNTGDIRYYTSGREAEELRPQYDLLLNRLEKMLQY